MPRPTVSLVAAVARDGGIGRSGDLLVRLPEDLRHFKRLTLGAAIVMGRKTWDSIGRPLPGRQSIVISRDPKWRADGAEGVPSLAAALARACPGAGSAFVIGGAAIYALALPVADQLVLTEIDASFPADTFFPPWDRSLFDEVSRHSHQTPDGLRYDIATYQRKQPGD